MEGILENIGVNLANRFMATQFPIWGADGSRHMDRIETDKFPDLAIIPDIGGSFMGWKATQGAGDYGFVDRTFVRAWQDMRQYNYQTGKFVARLPFHFWDYAPGHYTGSPELFGAQQGRYFWQTIKNDPGEIKGYIDAEPFAAWFYLNWLNQSKPMQICRGIVKAYADAAGVMPGLYTSPGMLPFFGDYFKDLDLWIAWYNKQKTVKDILAVLARCNWRGKLRIWQYGSDGDIDQDGIADGLQLGMEEKNLDLNIFTGDAAEFSAYCGKAPAPIPPDTEQKQVENPVIIHNDEIKTMTVVNPQGLNIRNNPQKDNLPIKGWLPNGSKVNTIRKVIEGNNIWRERKEGGFVAEVYNNFTYLK